MLGANLPTAHIIVMTLCGNKPASLQRAWI
jgi:hypothetical protein